MWYVYFLRMKNGHVYVGSTHDLRRRLAAHQAGRVTSTRPYLPVTLQSYVAVETEETARRLETYFKSGSGKAFAKKRLWPGPSRASASAGIARPPTGAP